MSNPKYYPIPGSGAGCAMCETLGLGGKSRPHLNEDWLRQLGYTHFVYGCRTEAPVGDDRVSCRHEARQVTGQDWLVATDLDAAAEVLANHPAAKLIWIPRRGNSALAEQVRAIDKALTPRLHLQWPHFREVKKWNWTWAQILKEQEYLDLAFPFVRWGLPFGWDLHNPEIDPRLDLEPFPMTLIDRRLKEKPARISIIIPSYNNLAPLKSCVENLLCFAGDFEVLVADDGSTDGTAEYLTKRAREQGDGRLVYLRLSRPKRRRMGGGGFRAGIARNVAAAHAHGDILLFCDSDILIGPDFLRDLTHLHLAHDLIQPKRLQMKEAAPADFRLYAQVSPGDCEPLRGSWANFQFGRPWELIEDKWKFASTFCMSIKQKDFRRLGGFRRSFHKYGFEDTDLGFRAAEAGLRFLRCDHPVYHFKHAANRSEFAHRLGRKQILLRNSAKVFFLNNPSLKIIQALPQYL